MANIYELLEQELAAALSKYGSRSLKHIPVRARVDFNIDPNALPGTAIDIKAFYASIVATFGSSYDMDKIKEHIPDSIQAQNISPEALMLFSLQNGQLIQFKGGVLRLPNIPRYTKIDRMGFGEQQVSAVVGGSTDEALFLCKLITLLLWKAAGIEKAWEDLKPYVGMIGYTTTTLVDLPFPLLGFLKDPIQRFIKNQIDGQNGYGKRMGLRDATQVALDLDALEIESITHCREISLVVSVINKVTGRSEDCSLDFLIHSRSDANKSRVKVTTELSYKDHCELLEKLVALKD